MENNIIFTRIPGPQGTKINVPIIVDLAAKNNLLAGLPAKQSHYWLVRWVNENGGEEFYPLPMLYRSCAEQRLNAKINNRQPPNEEAIRFMMESITELIGEEPDWYIYNPILQLSEDEITAQLNELESIFMNNKQCRCLMGDTISYIELKTKDERIMAGLDLISALTAIARRSELEGYGVLKDNIDDTLSIDELIESSGEASVYFRQCKNITELATNVANELADMIGLDNVFTKDDLI